MAGSMRSAPPSLALRLTPVPSTRGGALRILERTLLVYRRSWVVFLTGMLEPAFYLLSIGIGVAALVGTVRLDDGTAVPYAEFIAPAMLAAAAMNGAIFDATYGVFFRLKFEKLYDTILATPLRPRDVATAEVTWSLTRGGIYSAAFVLLMVALGYAESWWTLLALPAAVLIAFGFAGAAMALTTYMRTWQDFEYVQLAIMPMFLFSATFYPLATYPGALQLVVQATPLYQGVALERALTTGTVGWEALGHVAYLLVMGCVGLWVTSRRLGTLLTS
ncbi:ABC transporter permease [Solicola sp. PLA-1-18]|uniref:ABC transporter permease n=1 Tax=Solicola sp. PLA-1-18 TaxID=3380532 RepID=UPI003B7EF0C6